MFEAKVMKVLAGESFEMHTSFSNTVFFFIDNAHLIYNANPNIFMAPFDV
jgi:hypothetical protein